jgi:aryl-alcohol dehydrogenase-like predicted oxidoreductase
MSSKLILGTVQFGLNYGINNTQGKPQKKTVFEILSSAYENGIRFLDTAELYGDAHDLIGEFHKLNPTNKFEIITKFPHDFEESLESKINTYLDQLNVETLSAILFHTFDSYLKHKHQLSDIIGLKSRKFKNLGVSVYTNEQINDVIDDNNIDIIQIPFNLLDNLNIKGKLLQKAKSRNKVIHTRSAFLQGLFFMEKDNLNSIRIKLENELDVINSISTKSSICIGSIALNYCLLQPTIDGVLIGVDSLEQLNENILFSNQSIPSEYVDEINSIIVENVELLNPSSWK